MRAKLGTLLLLLIVFCSFDLTAQNDTLRLSLEEAIAIALENNVQAKNARLDYEINRKRALEIITEGLPRIDLDITYKNNLKLPSTVIPAGTFGGNLPPEESVVKFGTDHNVNADFMVSQLIADGRYFIGLKATKTLRSIGEEQVLLANSDVRNMITKSYYAVLVANEGRQLVQQNLGTLDQLLYETSELYKSGFAEELDVDRLQLQLSNMQSNEKRTELQYELAVNALEYQMGLDYATEIILTDSLDQLLTITAVQPLEPFSYEQRHEFRLMNLQANMRGFDAQRIRAAYMPSLYAFGSYGFNAQRDEFNIFDFDERWFSVAYWGLELKIPIFDSYKNGSIYKQKKYEEMKMRNEIENFKQQANLQVAQAQAQYENAMREYQNQQKNLELAQKIYDKVTIMYKEGVTSSLELATAESDLNQAQSNYMNAVYDVLVKETDLQKALGKY